MPELEEEIRAIFTKHTIPEEGDEDLIMFDTDAIIKDLAAHTRQQVLDELGLLAEKSDACTFGTGDTFEAVPLSDIEERIIALKSKEKGS